MMSSSTTTQKQIIAIAGAGDMAKHLVTALIPTPREIHILSRADRPWFSSNPRLTFHVTDYTLGSLFSILNTTGATILFSFLHSNAPEFYNVVHRAMLQACDASDTCKSFVPSEYGGDLTTPESARQPRFYEPTHGAVREELRRYKKEGGEVKWTLMNGGWFMDYFLPPKQRFLKSLGPVWPLDLFGDDGEVKRDGELKAVIPGTGEERVSWTAAEDVAQALVRLVGIPGEEWVEETYVAGAIGSWNGAVEVVERYYGKKLAVSYISPETIQQTIREHEGDEDPSVLWKAYMDEWNYSGASAVPWDRVLEARQKYFEGVRFRGIEELMRDAEVVCPK